MTTRTDDHEDTHALTLPSVSLQAAQEVKEEIAILQSLVKSSLTRNIDYGRIPGTPADSLWEPGAAMIINAFTCYAGESRILSMRDDNERISICLEVPVISRVSGRVIATGIGAASTMETKHKYRWLNAGEAMALGYDEAALQTFKKKVNDNNTEYRVPNPEHGELLNTIVKMARKRAEVDAAEALPGVSSALRQMFTGRYQSKGNSEKPAKQGPQNNEWTQFWGKIRQMGIDQGEVYKKLSEESGREIESLQRDWVEAGQTLERAIEILAGA